MAISEEYQKQRLFMTWCIFCHLLFHTLANEEVIGGSLKVQKAAAKPPRQLVNREIKSWSLESCGKFSRNPQSNFSHLPSRVIVAVWQWQGQQCMVAKRNTQNLFLKISRKRQKKRWVRSLVSSRSYLKQKLVNSAGHTSCLAQTTHWPILSILF